MTADQFKNTHANAGQERVVIFDTTLRDGDQSPGYALRVHEKIEMAHALARMGVDVIEAGFPMSSKLDFRSVKLIAENVRGPRIAALARAEIVDIQSAADALINCPSPRIHTFIATSEEHMRYKLRKTPDQVLRDIDTSVRFASKCMEGLGDVEWSAEDASRSSLDFLAQCVRVAINAGATTINLPDTVGYAMPDEYKYMFEYVIDVVKPASNIIFSAHTHNDLGNAVSNAIAALHGGARQVECTVTGVGERAGNAQFEAFISNLKARPDRNPFSHGIDTHQLKSVADRYTRMIKGAPSYLPIVGDNAFAHASGIHQHGTVRGDLYAILNARDVGHDDVQYPLGRHSGMAGVGKILEQNGIIMPTEQLADFTAIFKDAASAMLENDGIRIVPPDQVVKWAKRHLLQACAA